jgi:glycogen debranching enzyme
MTSAGEPEGQLGPAEVPLVPVADGVEAPQLRELESAPDVPAEAREDLLALKSGAAFVCARRDGTIRPARASGEGLYVEDTRHLSELRLMVGGLPPVPLSSVMESGHYAVINATNPVLRSADGTAVPQETLNVRWTLLMNDRLFYRVRVRNFDLRPVATVAEVSLAADFADVFEVRGVGRATNGRLLDPIHDENCVRFGYVAADGQHRETLVELEPSPARVRIDGGRVHVAWDVRLDVRESISLVYHRDAYRRQRRSRRDDSRAGGRSAQVCTHAMG